jgi:hypothetical protein
MYLAHCNCLINVIIQNWPFSLFWNVCWYMQHKSALESILLYQVFKTMYSILFWQSDINPSEFNIFYYF